MCLARGGRLHLPDCGEQQKVSRFHNRQLRFSSRFPSSMASEILEKTVCMISELPEKADALQGERTGPHAKEILDGASIDGVHFVDVDFEQRVLRSKRHGCGDSQWLQTEGGVGVGVDVQIWVRRLRLVAGSLFAGADCVKIVNTR